MKWRVSISLDGIVLVLGFLLSLFNPSLLTIMTVVSPIIFVLLWRNKGAILAFLFLQLRSVLNPGLFCQYEGIASMAKWGIVFILSIYLIATGTGKITDRGVRKAIGLVILFASYAVISSLFVSSYPLVAAFKVLSYVIPFVAIIIGIYNTGEINWTKILMIPLGTLLFSGIIIYNQSVGYFRNGYAFQGFFSHPNVFGAMLALFVACYIYHERKLGPKQIVVIAIAMFFAIQSGSRTGMLSIVIAIIVYLLTLEMRGSFRAGLIGVLIVAIVIIALSSGVSSTISELLFKGHSDSIFYSRANQIASNFERFTSHPLTGTGFNVPYFSGTRTWAFSFEMAVENGNIVLALLGDTGLIGLILFFIAYFKMYRIGAGMLATMFLVPFAVSMGEMSFFSTNNFGIIMYIMISIYVSDASRRNTGSS